MTDERLERELSLARRAAPVFGLGRQQQAIWGVRRRLRAEPSRARRFIAIVAAACVLSALAGAVVWVRHGAGEIAERGAKDERWELRDGSRILIETPDTQITKRRESNDDVLFELTAGAALFDVARRPERKFRVQAGAVEVDVIGTRFRVERQGEQTLVAVERGRVLVRWAAASNELAAGERGVYPPPQVVAATAQGVTGGDRAARNAEPAPLTAKQAPTPADVPATAPVESAQRAPSAEDLFATADHARTLGRPQEAVHALRELTERYPRDGRASLAAFTRGRLLLENLGQPREAARAFAQARALAGGGSALAEDALAREADAWHSAGNTNEAARCATLYRTLYPHGAHLKEVLRLGDVALEK